MCRSFAHAGIKRRKDSPGVARARHSFAPYTRPGVDAPARSGTRSLAIPRTLSTSAHSEHKRYLHARITEGMSDLFIRESYPGCRQPECLPRAVSARRRRRSA